jgi:hypothetical protein
MVSNRTSYNSTKARKLFAPEEIPEVLDEASMDKDNTCHL